MQLGALAAAPAKAGVALVAGNRRLAGRLLTGGTAAWALAKVVKRLALAFADWVGLIRSGRAALVGDPAHQG